MPTSHPPDVGSLKKRLLSCYKEWESLDMKRLASYYSTKGDLIIFNDIEPPQFEGWEEFRQGEERIISGMKWWKLEPVNVRVSTWGNVGLTTSTQS